MLGTRVHCSNLFGRFYMLAIDLVHRRYVTPNLLRLAVEHAMAQEVRIQTGVRLAGVERCFESGA